MEIDPSPTRRPRRWAQKNLLPGVAWMRRKTSRSLASEMRRAGHNWRKRLNIPGKSAMVASRISTVSNSMIVKYHVAATQSNAL